MCIVIFTTAHPEYPFILINNRDEFLHRPTASANWWATPHNNILGGYDLHRAEHGTWLGITKQGRLAVLTNYLEKEQAAVVVGTRSRGGIVNAFLKMPTESSDATSEFARKLFKKEGDSAEGVGNVGGFSMLFGDLKKVGRGIVNSKAYDGLVVLSNRTPDVSGLIWVARQPGETCGLSNSFFGDRSWQKVVWGEKELKMAVMNSEALEEDKETLILRLFAILNMDTLPRRKKGEELSVYLNQLQHSIFIPIIGEDDKNDRSEVVTSYDNEVDGSRNLAFNPTAGPYGTQKQTVLLVDKRGEVTFVERTRYDDVGVAFEGDGIERRFEFQIEGWA